MQSLGSLGAKSDVEVSRPVVEVSESAPRSLAVELLGLLGSGALAGFVFGVADIVRVRVALGSWVGLSTSAALIGLWLWFGQTLAALVWLTRVSAREIKSRLHNQATWHALLAVVAGALALLLARKVFAGNGIRQTHIAGLATWVLPLGVATGAWVTARLLDSSRVRLARWAIVVATAALSIGTVVLDACAFRVYLYLHIWLLSAGLALALHAVDLMRVPANARHTVLTVSLLTLPSLIAFPASQSARDLLAQPSWAGLRLIDYAIFHVDFDHDGRSPVFGGADCDDADASVFVGAPERAGDGRDSDCDGLDDPKLSTLAFEAFHTRTDQRARQISERAKAFPTVVILVDALRFDRIGNPRFRNLAQLERESIRFTRAYATSSRTLTSVPAIMSGRVRPAPERDNIAQSLTRSGQSSRFVAPDALTVQFESLKQQDPLRSFASRDSIPTDYRTGWPVGDTVSTTAQMTAAAIKHLDSAQPPELLWLHYYDLHQWNVLEGEGLPPRGDLARYDAVLERMDADLRPLLDRRDRVTFVLLADHGEALGTRDINTHTDFMFEELAHIPLLVHVPGIEAATVDVPVGSPGVFNMLRALRGLEPDASADASLLALVGATDVGAGPGFPGFDRVQWSFLYGKHRLLYLPHKQVVELYDVEQDPLERMNLAGVNAQLASELLARLLQVHLEPPQ